MSLDRIREALDYYGPMVREKFGPDPALLHSTAGGPMLRFSDVQGLVDEVARVRRQTEAKQERIEDLRESQSGRRLRELDEALGRSVRLTEQVASERADARELVDSAARMLKGTPHVKRHPDGPPWTTYCSCPVHCWLAAYEARGWS